jgi:hypothetical protein
VNRYVLPALLAVLPLAVSAASRLRYENIRDDEVAEIRQVVAKIAPGIVINIDSVVEGCDCAEGSACTDQVRVVSQRSDRPFFLLLSRMNGHWDLGPVEKWERAAADLSRRHLEIIGPVNAPDHRLRLATYWNQVDLLNQMKPRCEAAAADTGTR